MKHHTFVVGDDVNIPMTGHGWRYGSNRSRHSVTNLPDGLRLNFNSQPFGMAMEGYPTLAAIRDQAL